MLSANDADQASGSGEPGGVLVGLSAIEGGKAEKLGKGRELGVALHAVKTDGLVGVLGGERRS